MYVMRFYISIILLLLLSGAVAGTSYIHGADGLIAKINESGVYYYHPDHLGSTSAMTDEDGEVLEEQVNLPFGELIFGSEKYGFTGKERDETELQYFGARFYDSNSGRFLTVDPALQDFSSYAYVGNNPLTRVDPDGRWFFFKVVGDAIGDFFKNGPFLWMNKNPDPPPSKSKKPSKPKSKKSKGDNWKKVSTGVKKGLNEAKKVAGAVGEGIAEAAPDLAEGLVKTAPFVLPAAGALSSSGSGDSNGNLITLKQLVEEVREENVGGCLTRSASLLEKLRGLKVKNAVLMGIRSEDGISTYSHFFVRIKGWGDIDVFPEGRRIDPVDDIGKYIGITLDGEELEEKWYKNGLRLGRTYNSN